MSRTEAEQTKKGPKVSSSEGQILINVDYPAQIQAFTALRANSNNAVFVTD